MPGKTAALESAKNGNASSNEMPDRQSEVVSKPLVDEFGLPIRNLRKHVVLPEEAEEERKADALHQQEQMEDGSDSEEFVDAHSDAAISKENVAKVKDDAVETPAAPENRTTQHAEDPPSGEHSRQTPSVHRIKGESRPSTPDSTSRNRSASKSSVKTPTNKPSGRNSVQVASEWSHQQLAPKTERPEEEEQEEEWQTMPAYAPFDIYNDDGKLIAKEAEKYEEEMLEYGTLGGAGKGYTRVQLDEDAQSATSMDDNTAYLFKEHAAGTNITEDDEDARDVVGQMQATKELLTEGQRIAYVGTVRLTIIEMMKNVETLGKTRNTKKTVEFASESMLMWSQKVMVRLYAHMEIGSDGINHYKIGAEQC